MDGKHVKKGGDGVGETWADPGGQQRGDKIRSRSGHKYEYLALLT